MEQLGIVLYAMNDARSDALRPSNALIRELSIAGKPHNEKGVILFLFEESVFIKSLNEFVETRDEIILFHIQIIIVEVSGFEPKLTEPKSVVRPLHYTSIP